jgi:hypothetical protein
MEIARVELAVLARTIEKAEKAELIELAELQLALVGGGVGDVILI